MDHPETGAGLAGHFTDLERRVPHRTPIVLIDASGDAHADAMIAALRERSDSAVHAVVYSHRHHGYNAAVDVWPPNLQLL